MAKVRIGFSTQFELENELVGIGTDNPTNTLQALGNIQSSNAKAIGVSTLTTYQGFTDTKLSLQGSAGAKQHTTSGEIVIEGEVTVSTGTTFTSGPENLTVTDNFTLPGISDDKPTVGTMRFNENLAALEFYTGSEWRAVNSYVDMGNRGRAVIGGGNHGTDFTADISYFSTVTQGNGTNFGDLLQKRRGLASFSSEIRGCFGGGRYPTETNAIEYITIASAGNSIDFGDMIYTEYSMGGLSNSTRGLIFGGAPGSDDIHYNTIATLGNQIDFGSLITGRRYCMGFASSVRGVMGGGNPDYKSSIEYVTIKSTGNAIDFGNLTQGRYGSSASSNATRGVWMGGYHASPIGSANKVIDYNTIASLGNAIDFGDLSKTRYYGAAASNQTRGFAITGYTQPANAVDSSIEYVNINSAGNAIDFGDVSMAKYLPAGVSDSHGGLGGF